jgi:hypothetical protein
MSTAHRLDHQRVPALRPRARKASSPTDDIPPLAFPSTIDTARRAAHVTMTESVTITFSQTGVQPPVYVVTSMSEPPWEPLEMTVDEEQTASANLIFTRQFNKVAEGDHQYKIRVGDGHWVVDDSKDAGTLCLPYQPTARLTRHSRR